MMTNIMQKPILLILILVQFSLHSTFGSENATEKPECNAYRRTVKSIMNLPTPDYWNSIQPEIKQKADESMTCQKEDQGWWDWASGGSLQNCSKVIDSTKDVRFKSIPETKYMKLRKCICQHSSHKNCLFKERGNLHDSFAAPVKDVNGRWFVQGGDYMRYLREKLLQAKHEVFITGWKLVKDLDLVRGDVKKDVEKPTKLVEVLELLASRGVKVYIALWAGLKRREREPRVKPL